MSWGVRLLRAVGWLLVGAGAIVALYLVYSLWFTNLGADQAQASLREEFDQQLGSVQADGPQPAEAERELPEAETDGDAEPAPVALGEAVAAIEFHRPGQDEPLVRDEPLIVTAGVSLENLTRGPGHYPGTAKPGEEGNFAVAGHRTTYGAPFYHLDQLEEGDEIHVTDRDGEVWVYRFVEQRIVRPGDTDVLQADPLGNEESMLTLTTCHPRFSAAERLIVFGELVEAG